MTIRVNALFFATCAAIISFGFTAVYAQQSTTRSRPFTNDGKIWQVEISRASLSSMVEFPMDRTLKSMVKNLISGFDQHDGIKIASGGFRWKEPLEGSDCQVFVVEDGALNKTQPIANIPYDTGESCFENASRLRSAITLRRTIAHVREANKRNKGRLALGPQLALMETILFGGPVYDLKFSPSPLLSPGVAGDFQTTRFSPFELISSGYRVKTGDTLSSIALRFTGKSSHWNKLRVVGKNVKADRIHRQLIFPEDLVHLSGPLAKALLSSSIPGRVYSPSDVEATWVNQGIKLDNRTLGFLKITNYHIAKDWSSGNDSTTDKMWLPNVMTGWQRVVLDVYDPVTISKKVYGSSAYEVVVATLCPVKPLESEGSCILPKFELPKDVEWWKRVRNELEATLDENVDHLRQTE